MSVELTKLRILKERAEREFDAGWQELLKVREKRDAAQAAYERQIRKEGLCPGCLQPDPEEKHFGKCYVTIG